MIYLVDVNLLIALSDPTHIHHEKAHLWFAKKGKDSFATCPAVQNGFIRILTNPAYPSGSIGIEEAVSLLENLVHQKGHTFWKENISFTDKNIFIIERIQGHKQLTDIYLLGLCKANKGVLATLDNKITASSIVGAEKITLLEKIS